MRQSVHAGKREAAPAAGTKAGKALSAGLRVGESNDFFEHEANRAANEVMAGGTSPLGWSPSKLGWGAPLQRKCPCGGSGGAEGECEECKKERMEVQRSPAGHVEPAAVPPIVYDVLRSPGRPLDTEARAFFEPRFGHDFSKVRVHADGRAADSARAVNALAYTVGSNIVFGSERYQPHSRAHYALVAHELTHVVQQRDQAQTPTELSMGSADDGHERQAVSIAARMSGVSNKAEAPTGPPSLSGCSSLPQRGFTLQRACLSATECAAPRSTLTEFVAQTTGAPAQVTKQKKRETACKKTPPDAACTADGHGAPATALLDILKANYPSRAGFITGIFVDKDMPAEWGAYTTDCASFMPPLPGGKCTFVPDTLKAQGELYQTGAATVGGQTRAAWLTDTIDTLTHETEHARFDVGAPIPQPGPTACKFADLESNLSEMAADLSEMHVYYRDALARPEKDRFKKFDAMFNQWVKGGGEDISGIVKELRCKCECADADHYIKKTAESTSTSQGWDTNERFVIHTELKKPKWGLNWPVDPPSSVSVTDLPTTAPAPLKFE